MQVNFTLSTESKLIDKSTQKATLIGSMKKENLHLDQRYDSYEIHSQICTGQLIPLYL